MAEHRPGELERRGARVGLPDLRWVGASHDLASQQDRAAAVSAILGELAAGRFSPRIAGRFPLRRAPEAHTRLASRTVLGKLLLQA